MSFPKYPDYKPSRLDTRAPLPSSWSEAPIKRAFDIVSGSTPKTDNEEFWDGETTWVTPADLSGLDAVDVTESKRTITEAGLLSCGTTLVPAGSIVISTRAPIGTLAIAGKELCTNQGCKALVPNGECSSRFAYYYLSACTEQLNIKGRGTTFLELSGDELGSFLMPKPAPVEQELICAFLDRETAKIDTLIAEQQRLIELLQEKRQAVISHAVTKGLNPNAPMKDSGVEWLGEVQEHWEVKPLKYLANIQTGMAKGKDLEGVETADIPYLRVANVQDGYLDLDEVHLLPVPIESISRYLLRTGDVLMNEGGDFDKLGRGCIWSGEIEPCVHQNHVFAVRPHSISGEWLNAFTTSKAANSYFIGRSKQSTNLASISSTNLMGLSVPVPPSEEASEILGYMNARVQEIDDLKLSATQAVDLLQERRSALISAAVTGQIDVRGLVEVEGSEQ